MQRNLLVLVSLSFVASVARAEEAKPEPLDSEPAWSLGVGVAGATRIRGTMSEDRSSMSSNSFLIDAESTSAPLVVVEHRLKSSLWLMGQATFNYSTTKAGPTEITPTPPSNSKIESVGRQIGGDLNIGLRQVLAGTKHVQLSGYGTIGLGMSNFSTRDAAVDDTSKLPDFEATTYSASGTVGVACDAFILPMIALRVSTSLVGLTYSHTTSTSRSTGSFQSNGETKMITPSSTFSAGLKLAPALELRVLF